MKSDFYLVYAGDAHTPARFWAWDIKTEQQIVKEREFGVYWLKYTGHAAMIPSNVRDMVARFELGHPRINRPIPENAK